MAKVSGNEVSAHKKADPQVGFFYGNNDQSREPPRPSRASRCEKIMYTSRYRLSVALM
jgi:hypothetical protein